MISLLTNKFTWIAIALVVSNLWVGWTAYDYAKTLGEAKAANLALKQQITLNEQNLKIARRREADLRAAIERANESARANAEQKRLDDAEIEQLNEMAEDLLNALEKSDDVCFGPADVDRLRKLWDNHEVGSRNSTNPRSGNPS